LMHSYMALYTLNWSSWSLLTWCMELHAGEAKFNHHMLAPRSSEWIRPGLGHHQGYWAAQSFGIEFDSRHLCHMWNWYPACLAAQSSIL
jgi:hypothetical protein